MNQLVTTFPYPEYMEFKIKNHYSSTLSRYMTPYSSSNQLTETIQKHHIKIPFTHLITRDQGISICPHCKAKYVGHQVLCDRMVTYWRRTGGWDYQLGECYVGQIINKTEIVSSTKKDSCGTATKWDLENEFIAQTEFFDFVHLISGLSPEQSGTLEKFRKLLPPGAADEYRIQLMETQVDVLTAQVDQLQQALRQVAEKMNAAGNHLSFGF